MTARLRRSILAAGVLFATGAGAQTPDEGGATLDCATFPKSTDEAALVKRFGRENVTNGALPGAEGSTERGTVIFAKDPKRRLEIYWFDSGKKRGLASVAIRKSSTWTVRTGDAAIGLHSSVEEIERANGRPFQINGFGWDYGGFVSGWKGGRLDKPAGGCTISARFDPDPKAKEKALDKVSGEKPHSSSDPDLRAVTPGLSSLSLDWPE